MPLLLISLLLLKRIHNLDWHQAPLCWSTKTWPLSSLHPKPWNSSLLDWASSKSHLVVLSSLCLWQKNFTDWDHHRKLCSLSLWKVIWIVWLSLGIVNCLTEVSGSSKVILNILKRRQKKKNLSYEKIPKTLDGFWYKEESFVKCFSCFSEWVQYFKWYNIVWLSGAK